MLKRSIQIAQSRSLGRSDKKKYESLYEEATMREEILHKQKEDFYSKVCTFKPKINPPPPEIAERIDQADFMERGMQLLTKREEAKNESRKIVRKNPEIGDKKSRKPPGMDIHEYLYGYMDKQKKDMEELKRAQEKENLTKRTLTKSADTDRVIWSSMDQKLIPLFQTFDVDGDG